MPCTVLIVDDSEDFRVAARHLLEAAGFDVVGEAADIASARRAARDLHPQLVLLDVQLPDGDGIEADRELRGDETGPDVVLVSSRDEAAYGSRLRGCGALGFIRKTELSARRLTTLVEGAR